VGTDPALCPPNDPGYSKNWEYLSRIPDELDKSRIHPSELALGSIGMSLDSAWQHTIGRDDVVIAVLDSGILWDTKDLVKKLYLNPESFRFRRVRRVRPEWGRHLQYRRLRGRRTGRRPQR
jgi:hypothetical protein